jgi:outer membrane protein TolC
MRSALTTSAVATGLILAGCRNPFRTYTDEYGRVVGQEVLHTIEALPLEEQALPADGDGAEVAPERRPDPPAGEPELSVSIEQCRAWTLENNLDLRVAMHDPEIARTVLSEEEAAFEQLFVSRASVSDADPGQAEVFRDLFIRPVDVEAGVRVPLRTGGSFEVSPAFSRRESFAGIPDDDEYAADLDFSITQPLLRGAGRWPSTHFIRIAAIGTQIAEARTKLEVIRQVAAADRAYWLLYESVQFLGIRRDQHRRALEQLREAGARFHGGVGPEIEIVRAEAGVTRRVEAIIRGELLLADRQRTLKRIMNVPGADVDSEVVLLQTSAPDPVRYRLEPAVLLAAALKQRVELLELELRLAQDRSTVSFEENLKLPAFTLDYLYRIHGPGDSPSRAVDGFLGWENWGWELGVNVEVPLGNDAAEARYRRAVVSRLQRLSTRAAREQAVKQEVLDALDNLEASWQRILATRATEVAEERNYRAEQGQYRLGLRNSTEVLDAENRLAEARIAAIAAIVDYQIAQIDLAFATGTLLGAARVSW